MGCEDPVGMTFAKPPVRRVVPAGSFVFLEGGKFMVSYGEQNSGVYRLPDGTLPLGADLVLTGWQPRLPAIRMNMADCVVCGAPGGNCTHWEHEIGEAMANQANRRRPVVAPRRAEDDRVSPDEVREELDAAADGLVLPDDGQDDSGDVRPDSEDDTTMDSDPTQVDPPAVAPEIVEPVLTPMQRHSGDVPAVLVGRVQSPWDDPNRPNGVFLVLPGGNCLDVATDEHPHNKALVILKEPVFEVYWPQGTYKPSYRLIFPRGKVLPKSKLLQTTHA